MSDNKELIAWAQRQLSLYSDAPDGNYVKAKWKQIVAALVSADKQGEPVDRKAIEDEVIERCAKVADITIIFDYEGDSIYGDAAGDAIRALKGSK